MTITTSILTKTNIVLAKIETMYGTDSTPTVADNAIEVEDLKIAYPFEMNERNLMHEDISQVQPLVGERSADISFTVEFKGSGTKGTAGKHSPLYQACGMEEAVSAGVSVIYNPDKPDESCTIYVYRVNAGTGNYKLHKFTGCIGNPEWIWDAGKIAKVKFSFKALYVAPSDVADPGTPDYEATTGVVCSGMTATIDAITDLIIATVNLNLGNEISKRPDILNANSLKGFKIVGRKPTININPEEVLVADQDFFGDITGNTVNAIVLEVGSTEGNVLRVSGTKVSWHTVSIGDRNGLSTYEIEGRLNRVSGNDEFFIKMT